MSQTYRIETVGHFSTYGDSPKGDYLVTIQGDGRELLLFHDSSSKYDPPKVGDSFDADVVPGKRKGTWRLKRASGGRPSISPPGGGGGEKNFARRPEHPRNEARMIHTSALSLAPSLVEQMLTLGVIEQPKDKASYLALLSGVTHWVERSYLPIVEAEHYRTAAPAPQNGGGEVPADIQGLARPLPQGGDQGDGVASADEEIPF